METKSWIDVGALADIPVRGARVVKTAHGCIGLFRTAADEVYAIEDSCPHKGGPLTQGIVHGRAVTCPLHNWSIDLVSGQALGADSGSVKTIALKVEAGRLLLSTQAISTLAVSPRGGHQCG